MKISQTRPISKSLLLFIVGIELDSIQGFAAPGVLVSPPTVEYKSVSVDRTKVGWREFVVSQPIPKVYEQYAESFRHTYTYDYQDPVVPDTYSSYYSSHQTDDTRRGEPYNYTTSLYTGYIYNNWYDSHGPPYNSTSSGSEYSYRTSPMTYSLPNVTANYCQNPTSSTYSETPTATTRHTQTLNTIENETTSVYCMTTTDITLSDEYTTTELLNTTRSDLANTAFPANWSTFGKAIFWYSSSEESATATKMRYRMSFPTLNGVSYVLKWKLRTSRWYGTSDQDMSLNVNGTGSTYVTSEYEVSAPEDKAEIYIVDAKLISYSGDLLIQRYNTAKAYLESRCVWHGGHDEASCWGVNSQVSRFMTAAPEGWSVVMERRWRYVGYPFYDEFDHWGIIAYGQGESGQTVEMLFDYWGNRSAGEDPWTWFRSVYTRYDSSTSSLGSTPENYSWLDVLPWGAD